MNIKHKKRGHENFWHQHVIPLKLLATGLPVLPGRLPNQFIHRPIKNTSSSVAAQHHCNKYVTVSITVGTKSCPPYHLVSLVLRLSLGCFQLFLLPVLVRKISVFLRFGPRKFVKFETKSERVFASVTNMPIFTSTVLPGTSTMEVPEEHIRWMAGGRKEGQKEGRKGRVSIVCLTSSISGTCSSYGRDKQNSGGI